jgi:hypothetical protein
MVKIGLEFSIIVDGDLHRKIPDRRTVEYLTAWQQTIVTENSGLTGELVQNNDRILTGKQQNIGQEVCGILKRSIAEHFKEDIRILNSETADYLT